MQRILDMAIKDLRVLSRDLLGAFFIVGFPILMGLFFGSMMGGIGGDSDSTSKMQLAVVDLDNSEMSAKFISALGENQNLELIPGELEPSKEKVRKGSLVGVLVLAEDFGDSVGLFWDEPPEIQLGMDPSRGAESAMIQGFVMQSVGAMASERFADPSEFRNVITDAKTEIKNDQDMSFLNRQLQSAFLNSVEGMIDSVEKMQTADADPDGETDDAVISGGNFEFAKITSLDITRNTESSDTPSKKVNLRSKWDISFPQAMLWGVLGCIAGFSASIAREKTQGTMMRLQVAPVSKFDVVAGKGLACFIAVIFVVALMTALGMALGMRPGSYLNLGIATVSVGFCFVGLMILLSTVGKTEQSVNSVVWMCNMVMAMIGGCMIPVAFMSGFIRQLSFLSPVRWAIVAIEGAIWRDFSLAEMVFPCSILLGVGAVSIVLGSVLLSRKLG
jgi:ABC-2 type transport system permease protein